jgi:hypothetical protein
MVPVIMFRSRPSAITSNSAISFFIFWGPSGPDAPHEVRGNSANATYVALAIEGRKPCGQCPQLTVIWIA